MRVFTRMLDNVVEVNGLPLEQQRAEILRKRRHGMGFLGLGSTLTMLQMKYGSPESCEFTEPIARDMAVAGWEMGLALAREKGAAPIMEEHFTSPPRCCAAPGNGEGRLAGEEVPGKVLHAQYSRYMQRIAEVAPELVDELAEIGAASPTTAPSRPPAPSRCAWPTTPPTASSLRSPTTTAAT